MKDPSLPAPEPPDPPLAWFDAPCLTSFEGEYASGCAWNARVLEYHAGATAPKPTRAARRGADRRGRARGG